MSIYKISRGIVVAGFVAVILFLGYLDIKVILGLENSSIVFASKWLKYLFPVFALIIVSIYIYIKDKTYKMKTGRNISLIYRYAYLIVVVTLVRLLVLRDNLTTFPIWFTIIAIIMSIIETIIVKKIIFNVSKSDILSVIALSIVSLLPNIFDSRKDLVLSNLILISVLAFIMLTQYLIDELKQQGIKNKKYLVISSFAGVFCGIAISLGLNVYIFLMLFLVMTLITDNLDRTNLNIKIKESIKNKRDFIYKIERMSISKLLISIAYILVISFVIVIISNFALNYLISIEKFSSVTSLINFGKGYITQIKLDKSIFTFSILTDKSTIFINTSKLFYIVAIAYILFIEILNLALRRRYDTKSTVLKMLFTLTIIFLVTSEAVIVFQPLLLTLIILIAIVNTSNIYLNREERIKLLNA